MIWIKYLLTNLRKVTNIEVEYSLITKSGKEILNIRETIIQKTKIVRDYSEYKWRFWDKEILKIYENLISKRAEQLLNDYQKTKRNKLLKNNCFLDGGDFIVKCSWDIFQETDFLTFKEFKEFILEGNLK